MEIDFSVLQPMMNEFVMHIIVVLLLPFIVMLVVAEILNILKVPKYIGGVGASLLFLFLVYQMFPIRF